MAYNYDHAEHDETSNSKKVTVVGGGVGQATVTPLQAWPDPKGYIGLVTVTGSLAPAAGNITLDPGSLTGIKGNLTLTDSKGFIGLTTTVIGSAPTIFAVVNTTAAGQSSVVLDTGANFIGLATVNIGSSNGVSVKGNVTLTDSKGYIGLVTATVGNVVSTTFSGNITLDAGSLTGIRGNITIDSGIITTITNPVALKGNLTLSDSKTFIGLTTTVIGSSPSVQAFGQFLATPQSIASGGFGPILLDNFGRVQTVNVGNVTIDSGVITTITNPVAIKGNLTLSDPKGFIGLVTVGGGTIASTFVGNVTLDAGSKTQIVGNVTLSDSKTFIGLTTTTVGAALPAGANFIGLVTVVGSLSPAAGNVTLDAGSLTGIRGNITLDAGSLTGIKGNISISNIAAGANYIGLASVNIGGTLPALTAGVANIGFASVTPVAAWPDPKGYIGLVTITGALSPAAGNITLDAGSLTGIRGNLTLTDSKGFIGLVTVGGGVLNTITAVTDITNPVAIKGNVTISDSKTFIGLTTTVVGTALPAGANFIGLVTVVGSLSPAAGNVTLDAGSKTQIVGNVTLTDSKTFIGLVTVGGGILNTITAVTDITNPVAIKGNLTLSDPKTYIGLTTTTLGVSDRFIGLVTAVTRNAGTNKTLIGIPVTLSTASQATIAVPSTNLSIYVTSVLLNSDATVRMSIKSGVTYLTGNASIGITLNPGGGWVETGSPDAPVYISTPSASINLEKFDMTGTKANVGGKIVYFTE